MKTLSVICLVLMIIGAINWGLVGLFGFNLVEYLFGVTSALSRVIYVLVGLAGIFGIFMLAKLAESRENVCVPGHARMNVSNVP